MSCGTLSVGWKCTNLARRGKWRNSPAIWELRTSIIRRDCGMLFTIPVMLCPRLITINIGGKSAREPRRVLPWSISIRALRATFRISPCISILSLDAWSMQPAGADWRSCSVMLRCGCGHHVVRSLVKVVMSWCHSERCRCCNEELHISRMQKLVRK